jgi:hypothetical protein
MAMGTVQPSRLVEMVKDAVYDCMEMVEEGVQRWYRVGEMINIFDPKLGSLSRWKVSESRGRL